MTQIDTSVVLYHFLTVKMDRTNLYILDRTSTIPVEKIIPKRLYEEF